jgi:hypothetical protein
MALARLSMDVVKDMWRSALSADRKRIKRSWKWTKASFQVKSPSLPERGAGTTGK